MAALARALVVDDDAHNRDVLEQELEALGWDALPAAGGEEALRRLAVERVDLVLLDVMMPGLDGVAVLRRLKADEALRSIPVIMVSALDEIRTVAACIGLGADDYLPKPFDPVLLKARLQASLDKKRWREQEAAYRAEIERERRRADGLLEAILPASAIVELKRIGVVTPRRHEGVAILFADIVDFTRYSERHSAEEVVRDLDRLMQASEGLLADHGLEKIKSIGDGLAATANLLVPHADPVLAGVRCGLDLIGAAKACPAAWKLRVGVSFGHVVAGVVGREKFSFDIWGDAVNVAARLSGLGGESALFLTGEAWAELRGRGAGERLDVTLKGKTGVAVHRCLGLAPCAQA